MLEVLKFIFSDFWIWLGAVLLVSVIGEMLSSVLGSAIVAIRNRR